MGVYIKISEMGYLNSKKNQFLEKFYDVFENKATPQTRYMRDIKCDLNNLPHFFDLLIEVANQLIDEINAIRRIPSPSMKNSHSCICLTERPSQSINNVKTKFHSKNIQTQYCRSCNGKTNYNNPTMKAAYHNLPVTMGESILNHLSSQNNLLEKATASKLVLKHGSRALKDSLESEAFILNDKNSMKKLKIISRLPDVTSSIKKIQIDVNQSPYFHYKIIPEFIANLGKLLQNFVKLETIGFGRRLWFYFQDSDIAMAFKPSATVKKLKFHDLDYCYSTSEEWDKEICHNIFRSTRSIQEITYFKRWDNGEKTIYYKRGDFDGEDR